MSLMSEFKEFAVKGNVMDLAVGVIIGGAFGKIVDSVVSDLIMPMVGAVFGKLDFSNLFVVLGAVPPRHGDDAGRPEKGRGARIRLRQLHHRCREFHHPGVHHLHDGEADEPLAARGPTCTCARSGANPGRCAAAARDPRQPQEIGSGACRGTPAGGWRTCKLRRTTGAQTGSPRSDSTGRPDRFRPGQKPSRGQDWFATGAVRA